MEGALRKTNLEPARCADLEPARCADLEPARCADLEPARCADCGKGCVVSELGEGGGGI